MAWDYDDVFKSAPSHPTKVLDDPLMFGCENELDRLIQQQSVRNDAERFELDLIDAPHRSVKSERDAYVEQLYDTFTARRTLLLTRLSEGG